MKKILLSLTAIVFAFKPSCSNAQPEHLDSAFNFNGIATTNFSGSDDYATASVIQTDGKIIVAGNADDTYSFQAAFARYNPDGTPDNTFGNAGKALVGFSGYCQITAIKVQPDGKIIASGWIGNEPDFIALQLNSNGLLDTSFGENGKTIIGFGGYDVENYAAALAVQTDGKIVIAGSSGDYDGYQDFFALARLNENGSVDSSFGSNGLVIASIRYNDYNFCSDIAIQPDGKIIAGGSSFSGDFENYAFSLIRFNSNGSVDSTFGTGGYISNYIDGRVNVCSILLETDSALKIITAGSSGHDFIISRFNEDGSPDNTFGDAGIDTVVMNSDINTEIIATSATLQPDGKTIIGGYNFSHANGTYTSVLARFTADGFIDSTFGSDGQMPVNEEECLAVAVQSSGRILATGYSLVGLQGDDFTTIGYDSTGSTDSSFATNGEINTNFLGGNDFGEAVAIQSDGKIAVGGHSDYNISDIARYNTDGSLDSSFNATGKISFGGQSANALAIQIDGKILVAGLGLDYNMVVNRFNANGIPDSSFGRNGVANHSAQYLIIACSAMALQEDGKILVAGTEYYSTGTFIIHRFNTDGSDDSTFGSKGDAVADFGECESLLVQPDGKIVTGGLSPVGDISQFVIKRFNNDGKLDVSFGTGGTQVISDGHETFNPSIGRSMAIQPDGKLLIALNNGYDWQQYNSIARLNTDGSPDLSFGDSGIARTYIGGNNVFGEAIVLQPDNKILVAGSSDLITSPLQTAFSLIRYNSDGSPDAEFGKNGIITTYLNSYYATCNAALLQPDGRVVLAGYSFNGNDIDFAVARYVTDLYTGVINHAVPSATIGFVYPNPVHEGNIILQYELPKEQNISLSLLDSYGNEVAEYSVNEKRSGGKHSEELLVPDHCPSGFYLLLLKTEHGNVSIRLDKQ